MARRILCLCYLNSRTEEVDALVKSIETTCLEPELEPARTIFLSEIAFSGLHCSALVASKLAERAFQVIESHTWITLRRRLLERALDGLHSDLLRDDTEKRIRTWYPSRHKFRAGVYKAMGKWPKDFETLEALIRGLFDEEEWNRRSAAEALAENFGGIPSVQERLLSLILTPAESNTSVYALHALCLGWPQERRLPTLLLEARQMDDIVLRLAAIYHRVKRHEHDEEDRTILLEFTKERPFVGWYWKEHVVEALIMGWPRDGGIKAMALEAIGNQWRRYTEKMDRDLACSVLMKGFPNDDDVARQIATLFEHEEYPESSLGLHGDKALFMEAFAGHPLLRDAVDNWLERYPDRVWDSRTALLSKSDRAKRFLLKPDSKTGVITELQARWLLEGWGMKDADAAEALLKAANGPEAQRIAYLLPRIISDKQMCRSRLLEWLRSENNQVARLALLGLIELGCHEDDTEVAEAALDQFEEQVPCGVQWMGVSDVIQHFSHHPRTRELALHQIRTRGGRIDAVTYAFRDDAQMRRELLNHLSPLPESLRIQIVDRLACYSHEDSFAQELLSQFDEDEGEEVKLAGSIAYAHSIRMHGGDETSLIETLSKGIQAVGPDMDDRIQAALAGLIELDRLDVVTSEPGTLEHIRVIGDRPSARMSEHIAKHWDQIHQAFPEGFVNSIGYAPDSFLEEMIAHIREQNILEEIILKMQTNSGNPSSVAVLRTRSAQWRGTEKLRRLCLDLVTRFHISDWVHTAPGILAAEILSDQFNHDDSTKLELESLKDQEQDPEALIIALCSGWPDSQVLETLTTRRQKILLPARIHLVCRFASPEGVLTALRKYLPQVTGNIWEFLPSCTRAIRGRFEKDVHVREAALQRLHEGAIPWEKLNFPQLLRGTNPSIDELRTWCRAEFRQQMSLEHLPDFALDIFSGCVRPVGHVLLDILVR